MIFDQNIIESINEFLIRARTFENMIVTDCSFDKVVKLLFFWGLDVLSVTVHQSWIRCREEWYLLNNQLIY
jgi:hypothetical protein